MRAYHTSSCTSLALYCHAKQQDCITRSQNPGTIAVLGWLLGCRRTSSVQRNALLAGARRRDFGRRALKPRHCYRR